MTIGVIASDASAEPENLTNTQVTMQTLLNLFAAELRIAIWIQETRFGGKQCARSIHVDRAAFQNHARIKNRHIENLRHTRRHNFVEIEWRIFVPPGVIIPIDHRKFWI